MEEEDDYLEVYVDKVHQEVLRTNRVQESSQGFKSGRATGTNLAKGTLSSALAAANVSMLEEGKDKNDARILNSGSRSALEEEQSYKNLSKEVAAR